MSARRLHLLADRPDNNPFSHPLREVIRLSKAAYEAKLEALDKGKRNAKDFSSHQSADEED